jgi:multimeric flavodoxin WrbA
MKVLMINGSRNEKGCTYTALSVIAEELKANGIDSEIFHVGMDVVGGKVNDLVKEAQGKMKESDALIIGSPVYYASPSGEVLAFLDRFFGVAKKELRMKPAAVVASARRAGTTATLDVLSKYPGITEMPIISSSYWNMVHGNKPEEVLQDEEGLQIMKGIGRNMAWILKCIEAGKAAGIEAPAEMEKVKTNFIR